MIILPQARGVLHSSAGGGSIDPLFGSVIHLSHFETTSGSTNDDPAVGNDMPYVNSAVRSSSQAKWGTYSADFTGASNARLGPEQSFPTPLAGDLSVEFWAYITTAAQQIFFDIGPSASENPCNMQVGMNPDTSLYFYNNASGICITSSTGIMSTATWHFLQLIKGSGTTKLYLNGSQIGGNYTDSNTYTDWLWIGHGNYPSGGFATIGYIDDFRITTAARIPGVPTGAFPDS